MVDLRQDVWLGIETLDARQIVPRRFMELIRDEDAQKVKAVMAAMMTMVKLDVAALERAYDGA